MLAKRVLYRKYAGYLYILNLNTTKSYLFEGIACDLMDYLSHTKSIAVQEIVAYVEENYEVENPTQMREEIIDFVNFLQAEDILIGGKNYG
ncbi:MAG: PqqD family protein [Selenomonadaceae bacterium]|nr:PqqD family protein [Selenomonadaceae bacterium]